jgi:hypothetical protein
VLQALLLLDPQALLHSRRQILQNGPVSLPDASADAVLNTRVPPPHLQVARLFQALVGDDTAAGTAPPACRQVLCVSHNAAFQQLCQHVVHLIRGPGGTPGGLVAMKGGDGSSAGGTATRGKKRRGM